MSSVIDDMINELNGWIDQPAFLNILNENRKEELRILLHKYFVDKANDMDILYDEFQRGIDKTISLNLENKSLKDKLASLENIASLEN